MFTNDGSCDVSKKASFVLPLFHKDVTGAVRVGCPTGASQEPRAAVRLAGPCPPVPGQSISTQQGSRDKTGMVIQPRALPPSGKAPVMGQVRSPVGAVSGGQQVQAGHRL